MIRYKIDISQKECDALIEMQLKHSVSRGIQNFFRIVLAILAIALLYCTFFLRQTTESKILGIVSAAFFLWFAAVGMIAYHADEISQLYVHVDYQGGGIGQRLLERAKTESNGKLILSTFERNKNAQRFYEKHGFSIIKRGCENEEKLPDITYEWTNK